MSGFRSRLGWMTCRYLGDRNTPNSLLLQFRRGTMRREILIIAKWFARHWEDEGRKCCLVEHGVSHQGQNYCHYSLSFYVAFSSVESSPVLLLHAFFTLPMLWFKESRIMYPFLLLFLACDGSKIYYNWSSAYNTSLPHISHVYLFQQWCGTAVYVVLCDTQDWIWGCFSTYMKLLHYNWISFSSYSVYSLVSYF